MPAYMVEILPTGAPLVEHKKRALVFAEDVAAARTVAAAGFSGATSVSPYWNNLVSTATVTEIVAATSLEGAVLRIQVNAPTPIDLSVTGGATDALDDIAANMVSALNLDTQIAGAAYDAGNLLTVSDAADALGDLTVQASFTLNGVEVSGFIGAITHEGIAGAALTVQLATDAVALPNIVALF